MVWTWWQKAKNCPLSGIEPQLYGHPAHSLVNMLAEISQLLGYYTGHRGYTYIGLRDVKDLII
jgi:hypothetical protein